MNKSRNTFKLQESIELTIGSNDNDGLIYIPNQMELRCKITNNYGKIIISDIHIYLIEDMLSFEHRSLSNNLINLDIKELDRFIYKKITDPADVGHDPFRYFLIYDFSSFEKGKRPSDTDWALLASLYCFACHVIPRSINIFLPLAKYLKIPEDKVKKLIKKLPERIYRKSGSIDIRGGDISLEAEEIIQKNFANKVDMLNLFENSPYLKYYSEVA